MKSLIKRLEGLTIVKFTLLIASIMSVVSCKSNNVSILGLEDKNSNEVHPLNMDFAESIDRSDKKALADVKDIPTMDYKIVKGDSLWKIARDYKTSIATISSLNGLTGSFIREGQVILVPSKNAPKQDVSVETLAEDVKEIPQSVEEVKEKLPLLPPPINEDDLLPVPEAP